MRQKKIIRVPRGNLKKIAEAKGVSVSLVCNALAFRSDSEQACCIRKIAIECYGGVETKKVLFY